MSSIPAVLFDAYDRDVIDVETFERFVELSVAGLPFAFPQEVYDLARELYPPKPQRKWGTRLVRRKVA